MLIRTERPCEHRTVENLTREAFWNKYQPGCDEHYILHLFRNDHAFIPELNLVLEQEGEIIAHIMYCHIHIQCDDGRQVPAIGFGPISVLPAYQRMGYGSKLIRHSLHKAKELGYGAVFITGSPMYYHRFGFRSSSQLGFYFPGIPRTEEADFSMVLELIPGYLPRAAGEIILPGIYECDTQACATFDSTFPAKTKERLPGQLK